MTTASFNVRAIANTSLPSYTASSPTTGITVGSNAAALGGGYAFNPGSVSYLLTANANGALTVDGVSVAAGDVILVTQSAVAAGTDAGLFRVYAPGSASTPWVLASYWQNGLNNQLATGALFNAGEEGSSLHGAVWQCNGPAAATVTIGTSSPTFRSVVAAG
jgi:hypothetical protein